MRSTGPCAAVPDFAATHAAQPPITSSVVAAGPVHLSRPVKATTRNSDADDQNADDEVNDLRVECGETKEAFRELRGSRRIRRSSGVIGANYSHTGVI